MTRVRVLLSCLLVGTGIAAAAAPPAETSPPAPAARFADLFTTASLWRVGDNVERVEAARRELAAAGAPALRWLLDERLAVGTTLERRALDAVLVARRDLAAPLVLARIRAGNDLPPAARVNLARLARKLRLPEAAPVLASWLDGLTALSPHDARALAREVLVDLPSLDPGVAARAARRFLDAPDPWLRVAAARSLGRSGQPDAAPDLVAVAIGAGPAIVRGAAALALVDLGPPAREPLEAALGHCAREDASPVACGFVVRAAAGLLPHLSPGPRRSLRSALDRVAALGPAPLAALAVDLVYGGDPAGGR